MAIVCFGEMLWDVLPGGKQPGGAPLNVAVHLHNFGLAAQLVSRVGADAPGAELLTFMASKGLGADYVQRDPTQPTGLVHANVRDRHEVSYDIVAPVAWDYLAYSAALGAVVGAAEAFVFGSLAARRPATRDTLYRLLPQARLRVFDVNLRPLHYAPDVVSDLLGQADVVKLNHHELTEIMGWGRAPPRKRPCPGWPPASGCKPCA